MPPAPASRSRPAAGPWSAWWPGGTSYLSSSDRRVLVGLGTGSRVERLTIRWPSGKSQTWSDLSAGHSLTIDEGGEPRPSAESPGAVSR